jgi:hypothetical protein
MLGLAGYYLRLELGSPKVAMLLSDAETEIFLSLELLIQKESGQSFLREALRSGLEGSISKTNSPVGLPGFN